MHVRMRLFAFIILVALSLKTFDCAKESGSFGRIVRGRNAVVGQFPYVVRMHIIKMDSVYLCGAALIGASWLLTAAHCVYNLERLRVHLGSISRNRAGVTYEVPISDVVIHPKFKYRPNFRDITMTHDIALIKIPHTVLNKKIAIVPIPKKRFFQPKYEKAYATACGWGLTSKHGSPPKILQCGRFQILSAKECQTLKLPKEEICTGFRLDLATIFRGDSGGPLVLEKTGELVGISSWANIRTKTAFTRVSNYLDWIRSVSGIYYC